MTRPLLKTMDKEAGRENNYDVNVYTFLYLLLFLPTKLNINASTIYPILFIFIHTNCYGTILVIQSPKWYIYLSVYRQTKLQTDRQAESIG